MKPVFALSLSYDGISLSHRAADGWRLVGEVALEAPDLAAAMAGLRADALALEPDGPTCKIVLPNDQIRYMSVQTGSFHGETRHEMARAALQGATPYDVADLAFDLSFDDDVTHIAAVALETLEEAESFALEHGFVPISFVAIPPGTGFAGEPFFGTSHKSGRTDDVERDIAPVKVVGPAEMPRTRLTDPPEARPQAKAPSAAAPSPDTAPEPNGSKPGTADEPPDNTAPDRARVSPASPAKSNTGAQPAPPAESFGQEPRKPESSEPEANAAGFASRRRKSGKTGGAPHLAGATRANQTPASDRSASEPAQPAARRMQLQPAPSSHTPAKPPKPPLSVTAATLDLPDDPAETPAAPASLPARPARSATAQPLPPASQPATTEAGPSEDETDRMTVFGARQGKQVGGKPRHLGLMLTVGLLVFLAAVAVWSALFLDDGVSGLLDRAPDPGEQVATLPVADPAVAPATLPQAAPDTSANRPPNAAAGDPDSAQTAPIPDQSPEQAKARYAATGIWPVAPAPPPALDSASADNLYEVSIDRRDLSQDALALPPVAGFDADHPPAAVSSPAAAGTAFALDADGLVRPSPEGTMTPDGIMVYLGRPAKVPPAPPTRFEIEPPDEADLLRDRLAKLRPRPRPTDLVEQNERARLGGRSLVELRKVRPKPRPRTAKQEAETDETPTAQAVVVSRRPGPRPRNFAALVDRAQRQSAGPSAQAAATAAKPIVPKPIAPRAVQPKIPTSASVARRATMDNAINLKRINLIGVYGTPGKRRALVRLPSGRYKKVKVGDKVDGGRILAIGDSELRYQKRGRNLTLKIPNG
ncbi:hypothetical protein ACFMPD_04240 [Sedimentitalea sp. HM32M-2]|uniref:hypothetical protein n=1 Tax=Sedimentitalea sp. HM32M-2 TaxID=3351566 RepID=UPI00362C0E84